MILLPTFEERFRYLKLNGQVASETFGGHRYLNQALYKSAEWKRLRQEVIIRDNACDLADPDRPIVGVIMIHHLEPITIEDILNRRPCVFDLDNVICVSKETHNALHYGVDVLLQNVFVERRENDTCPWRY